jgi:predicted amidophosphoribosyltransferase
MDVNCTNKVMITNSCNYCGKILKDNWKFCPSCKKQIETFSCLFCGQEIKTNWNYCPHCKNEVKTEYKSQQRVDKCNEWLSDVLNNKIKR